MVDLDVFRNEFLPNIERATVTYAQWRKQQPAEYQKWISYRDALLAGKAATPSTVGSRFAKALVAAGRMGVDEISVLRDEFLPNAETATITYLQWRKQQPAEHKKWVVYRDAVLAGNLSDPPVLSSRFGKMLMAAGHLAERTDMKVTLSTSGGTQNLIGTVTITATVTPPVQAAQVTSVAFLIDGVLKSSDTSSPYTYSWDTTTVSDGTHIITAKANSPKFQVTEGKLNVTVDNVPTPPPPPPVQDVPALISAPTISDPTPQEGQTITVTNGDWTNGPTSYSRQWLRGVGSSPIPSATGSSYTCSAADVGEVLSCAVTAHNIVGASIPAQTDATAAVSALVAAVPALITTPVISGTPQVGNSLGISNGSWTNSPTSYARQWKRCASSIVSSSINDGDTVVNNRVWTVTVVPEATLVEFYIDGVQVGTDTSEPYQHTITGLSNGSHQLGLAVTVGGVRSILTESDVIGAFAVVTVAGSGNTYLGAGDAISDATGVMYALQAADVGKTIRCVTTAINTTGSSIPVQSEQTSVVTSSVAPPPEPSPNAYWDESFESGIVPAGWLTETNVFGSGSVSNVTLSFVADPLSQKGTVLRLRCAYDSGKVAAGTDYPSASRQLASLYRGSGQAHSGYQTISEETWYRVRFMFPSGNVFSDGEGNMIVEWHTDNSTQSLGGNSPLVLAGYGYPLTADGTTSPLGIFMRWNSGNPAGAGLATYWPSSDGSGSFNAKVGIPVQTNHWYDMVHRVIWSTSSSIGRVAWWVDGVKYLDRAMATMYVNPNNFNGQSYHNYGLYNYRYNVTGDSNFYFDGCVAGPSATSIGFTIP